MKGLIFAGLITVSVAATWGASQLPVSAIPKRRPVCNGVSVLCVKPPTVCNGVAVLCRPVKPNKPVCHFVPPYQPRANVVTGNPGAHCPGKPPKPQVGCLALDICPPYGGGYIEARPNKRAR
jgi:hypothetical protein